MLNCIINCDSLNYERHNDQKPAETKKSSQKLHSNKLEYIKDIEKIIAQTSTGQITVLLNHCRLMTMVTKCDLYLKDNIKITLETCKGVLLVENNEVKIECEELFAKEALVEIA